MRAIIILFALLSCSYLVYAEECDCYTYPFKPNPPCYGICIANLSAKTQSETVSVKNIDPDVSKYINDLSRSTNRSSIDFNSIRGKSDLEQAAYKSNKELEKNIDTPDVQPDQKLKPRDNLDLQKGDRQNYQDRATELSR